MAAPCNSSLSILRESWLVRLDILWADYIMGLIERLCSINKEKEGLTTIPDINLGPPCTYTLAKTHRYMYITYVHTHTHKEFVKNVVAAGGERRLHQ